MSAPCPESCTSTSGAGSPDDVRREVRRALDAGVDIIAPECAVPLDAPMANVKAVADAVKEYTGHLDVA